MQFVFPTFLWALSALAIPVIIHLFHFRKFKKVYFTNVHLLKEIEEETSAKSKLKSWLILLSRLLALAMLVFAFAQPIIKYASSDSTGPKLVSIFVDNSFSMKGTKDEVPLLVIAKDKAADIIESYGETDKFLVLTHDLESRHQRLVDKKTALQFLSEINATPTVKNLGDIIKVIQRITSGKNDQQEEKMVYLLSDFQKNISDLEAPADSTMSMSLLPVRSVQENNVAITNAYFEAPVPMNNMSNTLIVEFENNGNIDQELQFRINYKGQIRPQGTVKIPANGSTTDTVQLTISETGWHELELIIDDYPIDFDNILFLCFEIKPVINILNITEAIDNRYINSAFASLPYYSLVQTNKKNLQYNLFELQDLIILDDLTDLSSGLIAELKRYLTNGGNVLIFPAANANVNSYNQLLAELNSDRLNKLVSELGDISEINTEEFIFSDVYETVKRNIRLPQTQQNYELTKNQSSIRDVLMRYRNGDPYLSKYQSGKGNVYLSSAPLSEKSNNLVTSAEVFVPMLYKMSLSSGIKKPLYYTIGRDNLLEFKKLETTETGNYKIKGLGEFIPGVIKNSSGTLLDIRDQVKESAIYDLSLNDQLISKLAFNYDRLESDVRYGDLDEIIKSIGPNAALIDDVAMADLSGFIKEKNQGISLWRWCLWLALLFLLIEILLLRFWK